MRSSQMFVKFYVHVDAVTDEVIELPDNYTDEQIEEEWREWRSNAVNSGWYKVDSEDE